MKNQPMLLPVAIVALTVVTLLLSARQQNEKAAGNPPSAPLVSEAPKTGMVDPPPPALDPGRPVKAVKSIQLSYGLDEIAKMVEAGVEPEVVQAFIENSAIAYAPNGGDIVHMHELGAPSQVVAALIRHGGRLRERGIQESKEIQAKLSEPATLAAAYPSTYHSDLAQPPAMTYNTFNYTYPDYPLYGPAGTRYVCYPRYSRLYPTYYFSRPYFPTYYNACRPLASYSYCAPRFVRYGVGIGSYPFCRMPAFYAGIRF